MKKSSCESFQCVLVSNVILNFKLFPRFSVPTCFVLSEALSAADRYFSFMQFKAMDDLGSVSLRICLDGHANSLALNKEKSCIAVAGRSCKSLF